MGRREKARDGGVGGCFKQKQRRVQQLMETSRSEKMQQLGSVDCLREVNGCNH
jgi:hypothetical protein